MQKFKECWCGRSIPAEWSECSSCFTAGVIVSRHEHKMTTAIRTLKVRRRQVVVKDMAAVLKSRRFDRIDDARRAQEERILLNDKIKRRKMSKRAGRVINEWFYEED